MENKFMGILPYNEGEKNIFVGREDETKQLYDRIIRNDYTVYYAASGEGKSSLIKAGLLPILRRRHYFPIYIVFNENDFSQQEDGVIGNIVHKHIESEIAKYNEGVEKDSKKVELRHSAWYEEHTQNVGVVDFLEKNDWWIIRDLRIVQQTSEDEYLELTPLFIFDQFEEVFTKTSVNWTNKFFEWFEFVSVDGVPMELYDELGRCQLDEEIPTRKNFKALFSFRTEYLGELDYWCTQKHFLPALLNNRLCLKQMTIAGAREVIKLNSNLTQYTDDIISGCADDKAEVCKKEGGNGFTQSDDCACVHALILSVICRTISDYKEVECNNTLGKLCKNPKDTVNEILLNFYKEKLKNAGLDFVKDEKVITKIENALIDENGKRKRLNSNDLQLDKELKEWIEKLSSDQYGLIKIVSKNKTDQTQTVELPHDRLCKAIDVERKNRQKRIRERLNRQEEWMQFGILSFVFGIVMHIISKNLTAFSILFFHPKSLIADVNDKNCTALLMILLVAFTPILTILYKRDNTKKKITLSSFVLSSISFGIWSILSRNIKFESSYISFIGYAGFAISSLLAYSFYRVSFSKKYIKHGSDNAERKQSYWPVWGAFLIVAICAFYLSVFDCTIGINEPKDSFWGLFTLPFFYSMFARGFFHVETNWKSKGGYVLLGGFLALLLLGGFFAFSHWTILHIGYWQRYGAFLSVFLIIIFFVSFVYSLWLSDSDSNFYKLTTSKRILLSLGCVLVTIATFFVNLGYNPFAIPVGKVAKVNSWRTVLACEHHDEKNLYGVFSANGDTIIPCCMDWGDNDSIIIENTSVFSRSGMCEIIVKSRINPFENDLKANEDSSLIWSKQNDTLGIITGKILTLPTLEERLYRTISKNLSSNSTLEDSINYYSSKLFIEIRTANIKWLLKGEKYGLENLPSLSLLEKTQHRCLEKVIKEFSSQKDLAMRKERRIEQIMTDQDLVELQCNIVRSMLLNSIKERCRHHDNPRMFLLHTQLLFAFFHSTPKVNIEINSASNFNMRTSINGESQSFSFPYNINICSKDVFDRRAFAWYDMLNALCMQELEFNSRTFEVIYSTDSIIPKIEEVAGALDDVSKLSKFINGENSSKLSLNEAMDLIKIYLNMTTPDYWQSKRDKMNVAVKLPSHLNEDVQFERLRKLVCNSLLNVLANRPTGVYNNCLENICRNMIIVSAFRGYNVSSDISKLCEYKQSNWRIFSDVQELDSTKILASEILKKHKKTIELLDSIICKLPNKQAARKEEKIGNLILE